MSTLFIQHHSYIPGWLLSDLSLETFRTLGGVFLFVEKVVALFGAVPVQFEPLLYVMSFVAFLWLCDAIFYTLRSLIGG